MIGQLLRTLTGRDTEAEKDKAAYRRLALQLHYDLPAGSSTRSAVLMSPLRSLLPASGALSLASTFVEELGQKVLLVDACPTSGELGRLLDAEGKPGWTDDAEGGSRSLESLVLPTSSENLWMLPAGKSGRSGPATEALDKYLASSRGHYDFLIVSGGSVLDDAAGMAVLAHAGCVLLVVVEGETRIDDLKQAQQSLAYCKATNVRVVLATAARERQAASPYQVLVPLARAQAMGKMVAD